MLCGSASTETHGSGRMGDHSKIGTLMTMNRRAPSILAVGFYVRANGKMEHVEEHFSLSVKLVSFELNLFTKAQYYMICVGGESTLKKCIFPLLTVETVKQVVRVKVTKKDSSVNMEDAAEDILQQVKMMSLVNKVQHLICIIRTVDDALQPWSH